MPRTRQEARSPALSVGFELPSINDRFSFSLSRVDRPGSVMALRISKLWEKHLDGGSDSPRLNHITNLFSVTYKLCSPVFSYNRCVFKYFLASFQTHSCVFNNILASFVLFLCSFNASLPLAPQKFPPSHVPRRSPALAHDNVSTR